MKQLDGLKSMNRRTEARWVPPPSNVLKVNVDGVVCSGDGRAAVGCVGRDSTGGWIAGEAWNVGVATPAKAELLALFYGLHFAWKLGFMSDMVETDSQQVVDLIYSQVNGNEQLSGLVEACQELMQREWYVMVVHIYREANAVADWIARWGLNQPLGRSGIEVPPDVLYNLIMLDYMNSL